MSYHFYENFSIPTTPPLLNLYYASPFTIILCQNYNGEYLTPYPLPWILSTVNIFPIVLCLIYGHNFLPLFSCVSSSDTIIKCHNHYINYPTFTTEFFIGYNTPTELPLSHFFYCHDWNFLTSTPTPLPRTTTGQTKIIFHWTVGRGCLGWGNTQKIKILLFFLYILPKSSLQAHNYKQNRKVVTRKRGKESHGNMVCCCSEDGNRIKIRAEWLERENNQSPFQEIPGCITSTLLNIFNICSNITVYFNQFVNPSGRPSCFNQRHHC